MLDWGIPLANGLLPYNNSKNMTPADHTSTLLLILTSGSDENVYGGKYQ